MKEVVKKYIARNKRMNYITCNSIVAWYQHYEDFT